MLLSTPDRCNALEKVASNCRNVIGPLIQRKMAGVEDMYLGVRGRRDDTLRFLRLGTTGRCRPQITASGGRC